MNAKSDGDKSPKKNSPPEKSEPAGKSSGPFDVRTVEALVALMAEHDLSEIDLRDGSQRLRLRRGYQPVVAAPVTSSHAPPIVHPPTASANEKPVAAAAKRLLDIKSPTPGTFYAAAKPNEPPFAKVGSKVEPETVVCLVEAMKLFNEIQAECTGVIVEVCVENQQPVEYGQVLFRVDPTA
ncbi:MAG: acetyl-CoA carboxylase biotin carboxyl carrier protein [Gemmataceae bacterium]|nr:acetyl-CoA carboxylase biotin carboxyl carrier protein [Gemmataceae bacterium]MCI0737592.1 acetyl-CoA carboxylase biotin carboxyl carrier protein [Gemmataceae bacterium]